MIDIAIIDETLRAVGIPIVGVQNRRGVITVQYDPAATTQQRVQGDALVAAWDDAAEVRKAKRKQAKQSLARVDDPAQIAGRNALRVIYASIVETRQAINSLLIAAGQQPLPIRTWKQTLLAIRQQIDAETDPEG